MIGPCDPIKNTCDFYLSHFHQDFQLHLFFTKTISKEILWTVSSKKPIITYQQWCAPLCRLASQTPRQCSTSAFASSRESRGSKSPFSSPPKGCVLRPGSHVHIFHLKSESFTKEALLSPVSYTTVKLGPPYNLIILIARSTVEINRFPVLVDPSRLSLHRIGARRELAHLKAEGWESVSSNV